MFNIGGGELLIILLVALIFLGPTRLPEVARQFGQTISTLRSLAQGFQNEIEAAAKPELKGPVDRSTNQSASLAPFSASPGFEPNTSDVASDAATGEDHPVQTDSASEPAPLAASAEAKTDPLEIGRAARSTPPSADPDDVPSAGGPAVLGSIDRVVRDTTSQIEQASTLPDPAAQGPAVDSQVENQAPAEVDSSADSDNTSDEEA